MTVEPTGLQSKIADFLHWEKQKRWQESFLLALGIALASALLLSPLHGLLPWTVLRWLVPVILIPGLAPAILYYRRWRAVDATRAVVELDRKLSLDQCAVTAWELAEHWVCRFEKNRNVLVSKQKEGEAETLIREKLRSVHSRLPTWVQEASPQSPTPANRVTYYNTQSTLRGVAQNFAIGEARGTTASIVLIDEAAFQEYTGAIIDAVMAMSSRLWEVTTPRVTGAGVHIFRKMIQEQ